MKIIKILLATMVVLIGILYMAGYFKSIRNYNENMAELIDIHKNTGKKSDFEIINHRIMFGEYLMPYWKITFKDRNSRRGYGSFTWYYFSDKGGIGSIMY